MQSKTENNIFEDTDTIQSDYKYNFYNTPWDDRSQKSKICIVGLLCAMFVITIAIITHNLIVFYKGFHITSLNIVDKEINCNIVNVIKYPYAARIHSITSQDLICIGAMVSASSVLASAVCLQSGPIRLYLGSLTNHRCTKGFAVKLMEPIYHDGVITKKIVLLISNENLLECGQPVRLGWIYRTVKKHTAFVIGRPYSGGRSLSFQSATIMPHINNCTYSIGSSMNNLNRDNMLCVKHFSQCPVRAGDLLVQRDRLIGIASTSALRGEYNIMAFFANLSLIRNELKELDDSIDFDLRNKIDN